MAKRLSQKPFGNMFGKFWQHNACTKRLELLENHLYKQHALITKPVLSSTAMAVAAQESKLCVVGQDLSSVKDLKESKK